MSILQERQSRRALAAVEENGNGAARLARHAERWVSLVAGQAMPLEATLALIWLNIFVAANDGCLHTESRGPGFGTTMSMRLLTVRAETPELLDVLDA